MSAWPTSSSRAPTGPPPASLPGLVRRTSRSSSTALAGNSKWSPSTRQHALSWLRCACVYAHKVAERRIRGQLRCRLRLILLELWREGITADLDQAAGVLGFCRHGRDGYCVNRPSLFRELGSLNTEVSHDHQLLCNDVVAAILAARYFC